MLKSILTTVTALALAAMLSACSGGGPVDGSVDGSVDGGSTVGEEAAEPETEPVSPADEAPEAEACALLDGIDIAVLLGEAPGEQSDSGGICKITAASADSAGAIIVQAVAAPKGAEYYARDKELLGSDGEIAGLGDAAHYAGPYRVNVLSGDNYLIVQVIRELFGDVERLDDALLMEATRTALANTGW
ncbi:MAG TPA: hypothetical protein VFT01_06550 [Homoserinimonas sp.]|nr:hypothetical protein [Homoserinimonas sp.]